MKIICSGLIGMLLCTVLYASDSEEEVSPSHLKADLVARLWEGIELRNNHIQLQNKRIIALEDAVQLRNTHISTLLGIYDATKDHVLKAVELLNSLNERSYRRELEFVQERSNFARSFLIQSLDIGIGLGLLYTVYTVYQDYCKFHHPA